jgi:hypothetical protein
LRVRRPWHPWGLYSIAWPKAVLEQRFPVHSASPPPGLTRAMNHDDGSRHARKVVPSAQAGKIFRVSSALRIAVGRSAKPFRHDRRRCFTCPASSVNQPSTTGLSRA